VKLQPHHIGMVVRDIERSTAFYEALGFRVTSNLPAGDGSKTIRFLGLGGFFIELFCYADANNAGVAPDPAGRDRLGFRHFALHAEDIDAALAELKAAGLAPADAEIRIVPIGYKLVFLRDPDGIEIELTQEV
jgi:catechol 2,3-dioxygenase-like lactoylglutathione lyase family enzyme